MNQTLIEHLNERHMDMALYSYTMDTESNSVTFFLFNLSGKLVGYHRYNPDKDKTKRNDEKEGRYYTHLTKENLESTNKAKNPVAVWGLETYHWREDVLFLVEGIFKACRIHNLGYPAIATLSNDPKQLTSWLSLIHRRKLVICDGDVGGRKLAKYGDAALRLEDGQYLDQMTDEEVKHSVETLFRNNT